MSLSNFQHYFDPSTYLQISVVGFVAADADADDVSYWSMTSYSMFRHIKRELSRAHTPHHQIVCHQKSTNIDKVIRFLSTGGGRGEA